MKLFIREWAKEKAGNVLEFIDFSRNENKYTARYINGLHCNHYTNPTSNTIICVSASFFENFLVTLRIDCIHKILRKHRFQANECHMTPNTKIQLNIICNSIFLSENSEHSISNNPLAFPPEINEKKKSKRKFRLTL